jgi:hypothetical protein
MDDTVSDVNSFTINNFINLCNDVLRTLAYSETASNLEMATVRATNTTPSYQRDKNAPPRGTKPYEWVKSWVGNPNQTTATGNCTFCGGKNHGPKSCFHLVPEIRPENWKSPTTIWVYVP